MTHAVELISRALSLISLPEQPRVGTCCVTGQRCLTLPRRLAIKQSFTRLDLLAAPESNRVGIAAWLVLNYEKARKSSWWCDGKTFLPLAKSDVLGMVLNPSSQEWVGYVTTSYKKHGALLAPVNARGKNVWLFETVLVDCSDLILLVDAWSRLKCVYEAGAYRRELELLNCSSYRIATIGGTVWLEFEKWAKAVFRSPLYKFLVYLLPAKA